MKYLEDKMDKVAETYSTQLRSENRNVNRKQRHHCVWKKNNIKIYIIFKYNIRFYF